MPAIPTRKREFLFFFSSLSSPLSLPLSSLSLHGHSLFSSSFSLSPLLLSIILSRDPAQLCCLPAVSCLLIPLLICCYLICMPLKRKKEKEQNLGSRRRKHETYHLHASACLFPYPLYTHMLLFLPATFPCPHCTHLPPPPACQAGMAAGKAGQATHCLFACMHAVRVF